jgi:uncharacterized protein YfiM (DUF2279 family)
MDGTFMMLLTPLRMRRKSWKGFDKVTSRNVSNTSTSAGRNIYLHQGTILKEMYLKLLYFFVFLRNKVTTATFWRSHNFGQGLQENCLGHSTHLYILFC